MDNQHSLVDLVAGYSAYATPDELDIRAVNNAPASILAFFSITEGAAAVSAGLGLGGVIGGVLSGLFG